MRCGYSVTVGTSVSSIIGAALSLSSISIYVLLISRVLVVAISFMIVIVIVQTLNVEIPNIDCIQSMVVLFIMFVADCVTSNVHWWPLTGLYLFSSRTTTWIVLIFFRFFSVYKRVFLLINTTWSTPYLRSSSDYRISIIDPFNHTTATTSIDWIISLVNFALIFSRI